MIDLEARKQLSQLLRNLALGRITVEKFDLSCEFLPVSGRDSALAEIALQAPSLKKVPRREVARWILFLQSGQEYEWPLEALDTNPLGILAVVPLVFIMGAILGSVTAGFWTSVALSLPMTGYCLWQDYRKQKAGADAVWPFYRLEDAASATRYPRLLNGGQ